MGGWRCRLRCYRPLRGVRDRGCIIPGRGSCQVSIVPRIRTGRARRGPAATTGSAASSSWTSRTRAALISRPGLGGWRWLECASDVIWLHPGSSCPARTSDEICLFVYTKVRDSFIFNKIRSFSIQVDRVAKVRACGIHGGSAPVRLGDEARPEGRPRGAQASELSRAVYV